MLVTIYLLIDLSAPHSLKQLTFESNCLIVDPEVDCLRMSLVVIYVIVNFCSFIREICLIPSQPFSTADP